MKKILILLLFCGFWANAQQYHDKGAKFENATNAGDTITVNTRIPIIDEFGLINYYVDVADLLALNPAPVLEWGNITGTLSDQTDLQSALNDKADQSDLTAHTSNGNIHFTQSAIDITESQISDLKDYLRGDVNDTNGSNKLTLGSLEVVGQTTLQNGLNLTSVPTGTSDNILTLNQSTGDVEQRVFSLGEIDIANESGVSQFPVGLGDQLRIKGSGDTSISFDGITNTININSTPGSGGGGAVTSFNGRDGAVVSQAGDYSTAMVNENTNLYFTEGRVRATPLTGLTVTNTPISSTNTFIQALGRLQGQINNSSNLYLRKDISDTKQGNLDLSSGDLTITRDGTAVVEIAGTATTGGVVGTDTNHDLLLRRNNAEIIRLSSSGANVTGDLNVSGNINLGTASTGISKSGNTIMRNNGSATVLSSINDNIILRPNGDGNSSGEVTINTAGVISATGGNSTNWNTAFGWGNHASAGYAMLNVMNTGTLTASNLSGTNTGDQTLSGLGGVPTSRTITAGLHLSGGGDLSANRSLTLTPTVGQWVLDSQGNQRMYFNSDAVGNNGIILKASAATQKLQYRDANNNQVFTVDDSGNVVASGTVTASNLSGTNTGDQTLSGLGGVPTTRTITAGDGLVGGGDLSSNITLSVDGTVARMNTTNSGSLRASGNIISDSNIQASSAIISGAGSFGGRVSGSDAINANEFVTRRQVAPIAASGSGIARLAGANTATVTNSSISGYYTEGGTTFSVNIPAGTFSNNVHLGAITIELNAALTYTGSTTTGSEDYSMDIVFIQGSTVDRIPFYVTSIPRASRNGYVTYKMTAISRSSAGIFMISGGGNQYPSGAPFMEPYTLNIDARQAFTIRIRKGSTGSDTNMDVDIASFVVTTMDGGAQ